MQISPAALALLITDTQGTLLTIFVGVIAVCVLGITLALVGVAIGALRAKAAATKKIQEEIQKARPMIAAARARVEPLVASTTDLVRELSPKVKTITEDVAELSHMVRAQMTDLDSTISEVTSKARSQVNRVNGMVSSTLDTTTDVVSTLERGIRAPIREVSGLVAGLKAGLEVLTTRRPRPKTDMHGVPSNITYDVHRAAEKATADAAARAREGVSALSHQANDPLPSTGSPRSVVDAGEEIISGSAPDVSIR